MHDKRRSYNEAMSQIEEYMPKQSSTVVYKKKKTSSSLSFSQSPSIQSEISLLSSLNNLHIDTDIDEEMNEIYFAPWYEEYINDLEDDFNDTNSSSFNLENDVPNDTKIKQKIISNAIESEKTIRRIFDIDVKMIPNKSNGLILYEKMKEYKEKFERDQFVIAVKATNFTFFNDDANMDIVCENSILYDFLDDDDMLID